MNATAPELFKFSFQGKSYELDFTKAFLFGDALLSAGQRHAAQNVFQMLAQVPGHGPRAKIMLARCEAALQHFAECAAIVGTTFDDSGAVAEDLHTALVYQSIGMHPEAIAALSQLAARLQDVPTIALLLGDELAQAGDTKHARVAWTTAKQRDRPNGEVALAAAKRLKAVQ
jgi:hypothetical protein